MESVFVQHMMYFQVNILLGGVDDIVTLSLALDEYDVVAHLHIWSVHIRCIHFAASGEIRGVKARECGIAQTKG